MMEEGVLERHSAQIEVATDSRWDLELELTGSSHRDWRRPLRQSRSTYEGRPLSS